MCGIIMADLQSLKQQQRLVSILMALAVFVVAIGPEALGKALPFVPQATFVGLVSVATWYINFRQTEGRVVRAEDIKEQEVLNEWATDDDNGIESQ